MTVTISLLTEEQSREIAEQAAKKVVDLLLEKVNSKSEVLAESEVMTINEAAEYLRCSASNVRNKIKKDGLPVYYRLGHPRLMRSELDKWLKNEI